MMIFKYCVWPSVSKDEDTKHSPVIKTCNDVEIIKKSLFHCCPCAFRRRQPIDIETNADLLSINTELPVLVPTPVISLTPNQCNELDKANAGEEFNQKNICNSTQIDTQRINNLNDLSSHYLGVRRDRKDKVAIENRMRSQVTRPMIETTSRFKIIRSMRIILFGVLPLFPSPLTLLHKNLIRREEILSTSATNSTDLDKETSSDDIASGRELDSDDPLTRNPASGSSVLSNESSSVDEAIRDVISPNRRSGIQAIAFDEHDSPDVSLAYDRDYSTELQIDIESRVCSSINSPNKFFHSPAHLVEGEKSFSIAGDLDVNEDEDEEDDEQIEDDVEENESEDANRNFEEEEEEDEDKDVSEDKIDEMSGSIGTSNTTSFSITGITTTSSLTASTSTSSSNPETVKNLVSIVVASRPHSRAAAEYHETTTTAAVTFQPLDIRQFQKFLRVLSKMDNNEIETTTKRLQSKVPRSRTKMKTGFNKVSPALPINTEKSFNKSKPIIPQCFAQLESNDWEVAIKGLKGLSIIARQQSEVLDKCPQSLVGRLLARHIKNLRSQVARTACMAAGDVFESRSRCLDHDLDEIAGPLLHRTADTNRFLRSDSNAALDRMIEHLPPHRTISVIIYRGASHQNAIVRASTSRLLASVVERMGPDAAMILPRDVREKLLSSGAKLLMDANLDARNHAKMMFKQLSRCEGFRKALKDSVPDTTLRHIDKTLRSL
ncbi:hypothetical protein G9C98_007189 [Cotesia typhae]|uniref:TOG domain-containing protein n=1 Tax=Cotesia typhae TaxID=2053667 RepID=A0A8J5QTD9_9HYME|nr:hypothetical protein G9C98_007189 [Cotesia typhae]